MPILSHFCPKTFFLNFPDLEGFPRNHISHDIKQALDGFQSLCKKIHGFPQNHPHQVFKPKLVFIPGAQN